MYTVSKARISDPKQIRIVQKKEFTPEQINEINNKISIINLELTAYNYMLYQMMHEHMFPVRKELERLNLYRQNYKNVFNQAMNEIDSLLRACRISENLDFMGVMVSTYDRYRNDYMKEGGIFFDSVGSKFKQLIDNDLTPFHYSIRMTIINTPGVKAEWADLATKIYKVVLFCKMSEEIAVFEAERIYELSGNKVNPKQAQSVRYHKFASLIQRLYSMVGPSMKDAPEKIADNMILSGQIILNKLTEHGTSDITANAIVESVYDYTYYCVARMLMDVRNKGAIDPKDVEMLKENMNFTDASISEMTKELKRTRIDISSGDPMEIKDYVPMMQKAKVVNDVFIRSLATILKEELFDKNPFTRYTCNQKKS